MQGMESVIDKYPKAIGNLIKSCEEMLKDSGPDATADYFEEKNLISDILQKSINDKKNLEGMIPKF
jgi:hypothetical protein